MTKLLLFDIDGTLMEESPTHTASFNYVCQLVYGVQTDIDSFPRHGMTDTGILYGLLKKENVEDDQIRNGMKKAFSAMVDYVSANLKPGDYKLLDNVIPILEKLSKSEYSLGILTGNLRAIASIRLEKSGISSYFSTGGYGDDSRIRSELVNHAIERFGKSIEREDIYLIGDTPLDIRAARDASVNAIGVATGVYKASDLKDADLVLENFWEEKKLFEFLKI